MSRVLDQLADPVWWTTVLIAGLVVNLAAAYLKPALDRALSRYSARRRAASAERQREFQEAVAEAVQPLGYFYTYLQRIDAQMEEVAWRFWAVILLIFAMAWPALAAVFYLCATVCMMFSTRYQNTAHRLWEVLQEAARDPNRGRVRPEPPEPHGAEAG